MRTGSVLGRRCKAIVYKEYNESDVSTTESVEQALDVENVKIVRLSVRCNRESGQARVNTFRCSWRY